MLIIKQSIIFNLCLLPILAIANTGLSDPTRPANYLVEDSSASSGFLNDPTPEFKELLQKFNITSENSFGFNKRLKYSERILEVGEIITVGGIAKWKAVDESISGYGNSRIAALESCDTQKLIITDLISARRIELQNIISRSVLLISWLL